MSAPLSSLPPRPTSPCLAQSTGPAQQGQVAPCSGRWPSSGRPRGYLAGGEAPVRWSCTNMTTTIPQMQLQWHLNKQRVQTKLDRGHGGLVAVRPAPWQRLCCLDAIKMKWRWAIAVGAYHDHNRVISRCGEVAEMTGHRKAGTVASGWPRRRRARAVANGRNWRC
jgi:hypothetical protein